DTHPANDSATDTDTQGAGLADLAITKSDAQAGYVSGTPVSYTLTVTNLGPSHAPALDVTDLVPASIVGTTIACAATGTASCGTNARVGNSLSFSSASVNGGAGTAIAITINGTFDPSFTGSNIVNTATVTVPTGAGYSDPSLGNNPAVDTDTPLPQQV